MEQQRKTDLINDYYTAVDSEDYEVFDEIFAESAAHVRPGQGSLDGRNEIKQFFEEQRQSSGTTHTVTRRFHDDDASYCKVTVSGQLDGDQFEGDVISEFQFDPETERIAQYRVFRGYAR